MRALELWAGAECTVNRVGDRWHDQLERTGHARRPTDLDKLAACGATAVRFPILWERTAPSGLAEADWSWADERLERLRALGLRPIVGLLHHGSGPRGTSLLDPDFPEKLAAFAGAVAARYPWIGEYTPINEPLTTARFSALYGHWYPHRRDAETFSRALVQQCRGIALAMRAIRRVSPEARLIQTEDMGTIFATPPLAYQAAFENERRWASLDLLCGRVDRSHGLWRHLRGGGIAARELDALVGDPCPPDVVGINYYVTSDRFLDHRLERYPPHTHGGNGRDRYADVEAVRVRAEGIVGHAARLLEAWERYGRPVALTEVHLGCSREEQLRWLNDAWRGAMEARAKGADVRAVTAWSAFGAVDWDSLLVEERGHYEPGLYDVRAREPRPTALVSLARELSSGAQGTHPVLAQPGWWRTDARLVYPPSGAATAAALPGPSRPVLIAGGNGALATAFVRGCIRRGLAHRALPRAQMDIADALAVGRALDRLRPWAVINAAGFASVDGAQRDPGRSHRDNTVGALALAAACRARGIALVTFSSEHVFDGKRAVPYLESDPTLPLGVYGSSKAGAERAVLTEWPEALVVRTSTCFGATESRSFLRIALEALARRETFRAPGDVVRSPAYLPDLVDAVLDLLVDGERGVWHLANRGELSLVDLAREAAVACGVSARTLVACRASDLRSSAPQPAYGALASERAHLMPALSDALLRFARERIAAHGQAGAA